MKQRAIERHVRMAAYEGYSFEEYVALVSGKVPPAEQLNLYFADEFDKLRIILKLRFWADDLQRLILADNCIELVSDFDKKWSFSSTVHSAIIKPAISDEVFAIMVAKNKLCEDYEIKFAKTAKISRLELYLKYHKPCKKALAICRDVRKIAC